MKKKRSLFLLSGHTLFEPVALPVHGQDVSVMGEPIQQGSGELFTVKDLGPLGEVQIRGHDNGLPPDSGIIGTFLDQTANMFKARSMRMNGLLRRIDESGQRTEAMLRTAAESMEAAEGHLKKDMLKEGLLSDTENGIAD